MVAWVGNLTFYFILLLYLYPAFHPKVAFLAHFYINWKAQ